MQDLQNSAPAAGPELEPIDELLAALVSADQAIDALVPDSQISRPSIDCSKWFALD